MTARPVPVTAMSAAFGAALLLAVAVFTLYGTGEKAVRTALDVTARWSFLLFWLAYSGAALGTLFHPAFAALARKGRELGLSFAAAHLVHIGLIVWLGLILNRMPLHGGLLIFFAVGIVCTYLMAALSFGLAQRLPPMLWRGLLFVAMNYILIAFGRDFVLGTIHSQAVHKEWWHILDYAFFAALCIAGPVLRIAAALRQRSSLQSSAI